MSNFSYTKNGRRFVIEGDTRCAPKGSLGKYGVGLNFDWDAKVWWTGKESIAKKAVEFLSKQEAERGRVMATFATWTKTASGDWAVRVPFPAQPGQEVEVRKASGETKRVTLGDAIGEGLFRPVRKHGSVRRPRRGPGGECVCGACDDLLSFGFRPGQRVRCDRCGGWAEAC